MAVKRCTQSVDGTIPVVALLYDDEELYGSQANVGIYDGLQKSVHHQSGSVHVTSHRLFYIDASKPAGRSFAMDLELVVKTDYYAGLFKSSAKITLHLEGPSSGPAAPVDVFESWECDVCSHKNPSGLSPAAARICALCGVPRSSVPQLIAKPTPAVAEDHHLSSSLPSSPNGMKEPSTPSDPHACQICTFVNHKYLRECEMCGAPLPAVASSRLSMKSAPSSRPGSPDEEEEEDNNADPNASLMMKLSFRKGGDKTFYVLMKRSLQGKAWQTSAIGKQPTLDAKSRSGIDGLIRTVETTNQSTSAGMSDALQDLETFMVKAKGMTLLAADLNRRLTAVSSSSSGLTTEPEEANFIRSSLSQLGLEMSGTPVTLDMMRDERKWIEELARELGRVLLGGRGGGGGMMKERGIIAVDEVWGGWNRARGVALIPPTTLLQVLPILPSQTEPVIQTRTFASGLTVLHTPPFTHRAFASRLTSNLKGTGKTTMEVAYLEKITFGLAGEMIDAVEKDGDVCRDDSACAIDGVGNEVRWMANLYKDYVWDGQE